jgi:hypothetical protein
MQFFFSSLVWLPECLSVVPMCANVVQMQCLQCDCDCEVTGNAKLHDSPAMMARTGLFLNVACLYRVRVNPKKMHSNEINLSNESSLQEQHLHILRAGRNEQK